ncbi:HTH-type transcriptional repressor YtrA [Pedobacter sp. Bi27]|uniref:GntR family transcriptional regulator n=1 Tax=unclassified Pedobacter TaxID=2628915 RepID=UPI001D44FF1A|nr:MULTISPECIES: GntR family transcriptional regulator [unclassified Pedobacter]CAH0173836.1 HTH-type transcriptional repressor YtrA [Pedobacter sp. Bi36]CAH0197962.1 HTH-type transcriptional repressor YtrA [Pedobacter sp. Bi27]CAH0229662.1 HTH-type transcriptional repressor YtrA [Pedobacter sp. Bi126]
MEFRDNKAIYLQIAEYVCEHILLGKWKAEEKVPSVRELAVELEVNPNTVMRTYELLQNKNIINNKRGIGFFVDEAAIDNVRNYRKHQFIIADLPVVFRNIYLLNIGFDELENQYKTFVKENFNA